MIFADFYGTADLYARARASLQERIADIFRARPDDVVVRRIEAEGDYRGVEVWIELSSDEQLARHGKPLAREVTAVIRGYEQTDVWVLFRIVPLSQVYLNGEPRRRGAASLD